MNNKALDRRVKKHILAGSHSLFIPVIPGLEEAARKELASWGLETEREKEPGSLTASGSLEDLWNTALRSRCASRLYLRLISLRAEGFRELRDKTTAFPWELYLTEGCEYRFRFSISRCRLHVTDNIAKTIERSITERFSLMEGRPPRPLENKSPRTEPDIQTILVRGVEDRFTLSLDAGGGPLYERGYRTHVTEAPLRETLAASLLTECGVTSRTVLLDGMCGSGTFSLEAAGITAGIPAGFSRAFPFEHWPSFRPARFEWLKKQIRKERQAPCLCLASDTSPDALRALEHNRSRLCELTELPEEAIRTSRGDFFQTDPAALLRDLPEERQPLLILNPPYGLRLPLEDRLTFFRDLGRKIRRDYAGIPWGIIVPGTDAEKALGLRWERKLLFRNGGLPVSFLIGKV